KIQPAMDALKPEGEFGWVHAGKVGAGHFSKMVHNGIEYAIMQLLCEAYDVMKSGFGMSAAEMQKVFAKWNEGEMNSYLLEITAAVLSKTDPETGKPMVDIILDEAEQKGTGEWTAESALNIGAPAPTINVAVETRVISSLKDQRMHASQLLIGPLLSGPQPAFSGDRQGLVNAIGDALRASLITTYAQGFNILGCASSDYQFGFDLREIARIWRAGCIIRAGMLNNIMDAYQQKPSLDNLMLDGFFRDQMAQCQTGWRAAVQQAVGMGIPVPGMTASLAYYDGYRSAIMPANLIQAQRDFFGAHTYHRVDKSGVFHTQWEG
ncbi:MAG TPA: NADP-dependent phosphogluconate dehydrogenase, partial [Anaerolineaceae bacterium]